jgi:5-methylcytosine-specific restriction endonuclease McrA
MQKAVAEETNPKYIPCHIYGFVDFMRYECEKKKYTEENIKRLSVMPYKKYLKTKHWKLLRNAVYGKFGRTCMVCGESHVEVHAHHHRYINRGNENVDDMVCLCSKCHKKLHGIQEEQQCQE